MSTPPVLKEYLHFVDTTEGSQGTQRGLPTLLRVEFLDKIRVAIEGDKADAKGN